MSSAGLTSRRGYPDSFQMLPGALPTYCLKIGLSEGSSLGVSRRARRSRPGRVAGEAAPVPELLRAVPQSLIRNANDEALNTGHPSAWAL